MGCGEWCVPGTAACAPPVPARGRGPARRPVHTAGVGLGLRTGNRARCAPDLHGPRRATVDDRRATRRAACPPLARRGVAGSRTTRPCPCSCCRPVGACRRTRDGRRARGVAHRAGSPVAQGVPSNGVPGDRSLSSAEALAAAPAARGAESARQACCRRSGARRRACARQGGARRSARAGTADDAEAAKGATNLTGGPDEA